jgi:hypothetical protein
MTYILEDEGSYWERAWQFPPSLPLSGRFGFARTLPPHVPWRWLGNLAAPGVHGAILVVVFAQLTPTPWRELSVYVSTGMILWDLFANGVPDFALFIPDKGH